MTQPSLPEIQYLFQKLTVPDSKYITALASVYEINIFKFWDKSDNKNIITYPNVFFLI